MIGHAQQLEAVAGLGVDEIGALDIDGGDGGGEGRTEREEFDLHCAKCVSKVIIVCALYTQARGIFVMLPRPPRRCGIAGKWCCRREARRQMEEAWIAWNDSRMFSHTAEANIASEFE